MSYLLFENVAAVSMHNILGIIRVWLEILDNCLAGTDATFRKARFGTVKRRQLAGAGTKTLTGLDGDETVGAKGNFSVFFKLNVVFFGAAPSVCQGSNDRLVVSQD